MLTRNPAVKGSVVLVAFGLVVTIGYIGLGHRLVSVLYDSDFDLVQKVLSNRAETPVLAYLNAADDAALSVIALCGLAAGGLLFISNPKRHLIGLVLSGMSALIGLFLVFLVADSFPPIARALNFDRIRYFDFRSRYSPDAELGFVERPFLHREDPHFRGWGYSPSYGIERPASTQVYQTDGEGFRNPPGRSSADVVVLGSSFPSYGNELEDTYASRLEEYLDGHRVANLAKGGYGPAESLRVLERFGLPKKPKYAILTFDTSDVDLLVGRHAPGQEPGVVDYPDFVTYPARAFGPVWTRFWLALDDTRGWLTSGMVDGFHRVAGSRAVDTSKIHPDVAVLRLPGNVIERKVFLTRHTERTTEEILDSPAWGLFEAILIDFRRICEENDIVPVLAYIPWGTEVYAEYSTSESGSHWLALRDSQVATSGNEEESARVLAARVEIELISFLPAFRDAAREGKFIYYQMDDHWNSEGSDIAARVTAEAIEAGLESPVGSTAGYPVAAQLQTDPRRGR